MELFRRHCLRLKRPLGVPGKSHKVQLKSKVDAAARLRLHAGLTVRVSSRLSTPIKTRQATRQNKIQTPTKRVEAILGEHVYGAAARRSLFLLTNEIAACYQGSDGKEARRESSAVGDGFQGCLVAKW
jgi:hypothetical protein